MSNLPSSTSVECFWKKPALSNAKMEHLASKDMFPKAKRPRIAPKDPSILEDFLGECKKRGLEDSLIVNMCKQNPVSYNLYDIMLQFIEKVPEESNHTSTKFIEYAKSLITKEVVAEIENKTLKQSDNKYWHYIRQGRITASILHQAAHCQTDGTLVQQILGGYKMPETAAIKRGKNLEKLVIKEIEKSINSEIDTCGFALINSIIGASPDGVSDDFVIEVKCPMSVKTFTSYVKNNEVQNRYKAQINCQMLACGMTRGLFCVADPGFETNKEVHIYHIDYDETYLNKLMKEATNFWTKFIFPKLLESAKK
jgi:hypothetical protein